MESQTTNNVLFSWPLPANIIAKYPSRNSVEKLLVGTITLTSVDNQVIPGGCGKHVNRAEKSKISEELQNQ